MARADRGVQYLEVNEEIVWLDVSVSDVVRVHVSQARHEVLEGAPEKTDRVRQEM